MPNSAGALIETILCRVRAMTTLGPFTLRWRRDPPPALPQDQGVDRCLNAVAATGGFNRIETEKMRLNSRNSRKIHKHRDIFDEKSR